MVLTTKNAGALILGRVRLTSNKGGNMPEIKQITITRNTVAGGKAVDVGDVLTVGEDVTESDATFLIQIKKAVLDAGEDPQETEPQLKDMTVPQLKGILDMVDVDYEANTKKADLIELIEQKAAESTEINHYIQDLKDDVFSG